MSYLGLTKRIIQEDFSKEDLVKFLDIPNVPVIQQTILKILKMGITDEHIRIKLIEYSSYMDEKFKLLGLCKLGHLAIYALKKLEYDKDFNTQYEILTEYDKNLIVMLGDAMKDMKKF